MAANIIFLRPVLLYAKIDNANKRREKIPVAARITPSILSYHSSSNNSVWRKTPEKTEKNIDNTIDSSPTATNSTVILFHS